MTDEPRATGPGQPRVFRYEVLPTDVRAVREIVESTGFFRADEIDVAEELVQDRLAEGPESGYHFVLAQRGEFVEGYACYGHIACTLASYDLYWIAVHRCCQGQGLGRVLLAEAERLIRQSGGQRIYVETSGRPQYAPTRAFYEHFGYRAEAVLADFYAPGDDKVVYVKSLTSSRP